MEAVVGGFYGVAKLFEKVGDDGSKEGIVVTEEDVQVTSSGRQSLERLSGRGGEPRFSGSGGSRAYRIPR